MATATAPASAPPARSNETALNKAGSWARRAPLLPALIFVIAMTQLPFLATIVISFMNWNAYYPKERGFTGFDNYVAVFTDTNARSAVIVTIVLTVSVVLICLVLGLAIALLLDRKFRGRGVVRTLMITPFLIVPVAAALLWKHALYNPEYGLFNGVLKWLFGENAPQPDWISNNPLLAIIVAISWQWTPFMMLILLAGLLGAIYVVQNFDHVFTITSGGLGPANLPYFIYQTFYTAQDYGRASAAGVVVVIGTIIIATAALRTVFSLFREESR